jgi:tetratricopeptide (TPR) repeat protein
VGLDRLRHPNKKATGQRRDGRTAEARTRSTLAAALLAVLGLAAVGYALLAGLRSLTDYDLGWQLATGRWVAQHHQVLSTDLFSYTATGRAWIYPLGSGLVLYALYLLGGYPLLSWLHAAACAGTTALLVRRGSIASAALAILAVPLIAIRTRPRADMFSVILFAAFLTLLWQQHQTGRARLWLLPILMIAWVNLHLGFIAGLALMAGYVLVEGLELVWPERQLAAMERLRRGAPWLVAASAVTLINPWGWGIFDALIEQEMAMAGLLRGISEWESTRLNWTELAVGLSLRGPGGPFYLMLLFAALAVALALWRRQLGAGALIGGAGLIAVRYVRFEALFACLMVVVAGSVLTSALAALPQRIREARLGRVRLSTGLASGVALFALVLAGLRSADLVSDRSYLASTDLGSFGTGLSWWFPERAAAFIERENIPRQIFNSYNEGGYFTWRLGPKYLDYIDGRAIPFGLELFERNHQLMAAPPDSPEWELEAKRYDINTIFVPLGRYNGLRLFPVLSQFCASDAWRPVYLDEVSAVFVRRRPETADLIERLRIQCASAPLPAVAPQGKTTAAFNQWANAAAVLRVLGRSAEAFEATNKALAIFPDSAFVHFLRGNLLEDAGKWGEAEKEYLLALALEPNGTAWSRLAAIYHRQGRLTEEIDAWSRAGALLPYPAPELLSLGYAELAAARPEEALRAFDRAAMSLPPGSMTASSSALLANLARGHALAWSGLGDLPRAVSFAEEAVKLGPERSEDWLELASLYDRVGRFEDAQRAQERALEIKLRRAPPSGPPQQR